MLLQINFTFLFILFYGEYFSSTDILVFELLFTRDLICYSYLTQLSHTLLASIMLIVLLSMFSHLHIQLRVTELDELYTILKAKDCSAILPMDIY
jgi:hypothetical protein